LGHRREAVFSAAVLAELATSAGTFKKLKREKEGSHRHHQSLQRQAKTASKICTRVVLYTTNRLDQIHKST